MVKFSVYILAFLLGFFCSSQDLTNSSSFQLGTSIATLNKFYHYEVYTVQYSHEWNLSFLGLASMAFVQPQVNTVTHIFDSREAHRDHGFEFGISPGLEVQIVQSRKLRLSIGGILGPHYIDASHSRQKTGFILNEVAYLSFEYVLPKKSLLINTGYRHLSNANWQSLNGGIDTWQISIGYRWQRT